MEKIDQAKLTRCSSEAELGMDTQNQIPADQPAGRTQWKGPTSSNSLSSSEKSYACPKTYETVEKLPQGSLFGADWVPKSLILRSAIGIFAGPKVFFNSLI